jgi:hypothetical protein
MDDGAYMINYFSCKKCGVRSPQLLVKNKQVKEREDEKESEYEEESMFQHVCGECDHIIAEHFYSFSVGIENKSTVQNFIMSCLLCGKGGDRRVVEGGCDEEADDEVKESETTGESNGEMKSTTLINREVSFINLTSSSMLNHVISTKQDLKDDEDDYWD